MSTGKQAAAVGFVALAIALMIFSFYRTFHSGPKPPPPEMGRKMEEQMEAAWKNQPAGETGIGRGGTGAPANAGGAASKAGQ